MSIYFDFEVGPKGRRFRRAVDQDKDDIEEFRRRVDTTLLFNVDDIGSLIELSTLAICMIAKDKNVTGFMSLCDHPNVAGVDPAAWELWIRNMFQRYYLSHDTLFVHFACCHDSVADFFTEEAFVSVFQHNSYLMHIVLVVPPFCPPEALSIFNVFKKRSVYKYCSNKQDEKEHCYYLYVALRKDFCPRLKIRRAVEEDNDDIVEILDTKSKRLKDMYGQYYVSEIIGRHPEMRRQILVAEILDQVVGVMGLSPNIDYKKLSATYELGPYHGLISVTPLEKEHLQRSNEFVELLGEPIMLGQLDPFHPIQKSTTRSIYPDHPSIPETEAKHHRRESHRLSAPTTHRRSSGMSKVVFDFEKFKKPLSQVSEASSDKLYTPRLSKTMDISSMSLLDDDAFDYDIINIDTQLITTLETTLEFALKDKKRQPSVLPKNYEKLNKRRLSKLFLERRISDASKQSKMVDASPLPAGNPNAFMIELFAMKEAVDPRRAYDMLAAAFDCMKTYEYCIIRVPCSETAFPLLTHFSIIPTKDNVCCEYSLYVAHRNSVLGKLRVRKAETMDIPQISSLFLNLDAKQTVYTVESAITKAKPNLAFVFMCGMSVIGVGILEPPTQMNEIRMMFTTDLYHNHKYHSQAQGVACGFTAIKMIVTYPVFEPHYRFFLREMMRLSGSTAFLWMTTYRNKLVASRVNAVISAMVPVSPRKSGFQTVVPKEIKNMMGSNKTNIMFSTWMLTKKLSSVPKVNVDTRIVVVGASRTAMAFINELIIGGGCTYLTFTNITLVSQYGLPYVRNSSKEAELMFLRHHTQTDKFLKGTPYGYYVNIVYGIMSDINRQNNHITLENGQKYYYDMLFLLVGRQYQHPDYLKALRERENDIQNGITPQYVRLDVPRPYPEYVQLVADYDTPENVFIINNVAESTKAIHYSRGLYWRCDDVKVLIYGASIETYCCLTALLEVLSAEDLVFIEAFPPENPNKTRVPVFSNHKVDKTVQSIIKEMNIECYRGYYFERWRTDDDNIVTEVDFISNTHRITLDCSALFYYGKRDINTQAFVAVNKCGLAYDGGILIDHGFRTNDPAIYAAGPATRYRRKYLADFHRHKYYDSYEVGERLGKQIKNALDPLFTEKTREPPVFRSKSAPRGSLRDHLSPESILSSYRASSELSLQIPAYLQLPVFTRPIKWHCILPGGLQYLEVRSPGPKYPHQYIHAMDYNGFILETFESGYFKLHLTDDFVVNGITCLTPERWSLESFKNLHGLPALMLNNVHLRYYSNKITDLFNFFRSPWALFLYHEQAPELIAVAKEVVPKENPKSLADALSQLADELISTDVTTDLKEKLRSNFERHYHVAAVTDHVIQWLTDNDLLLPMYMRPWQKVEFEHDLHSSPIFQKRKKTLKKMLSFIKPTDDVNH